MTVSHHSSRWSRSSWYRDHTLSYLLWTGTAGQKGLGRNHSQHFYLHYDNNVCACILVLVLKIGNSKKPLPLITSMYQSIKEFNRWVWRHSADFAELGRLFFQYKRWSLVVLWEVQGVLHQTPSHNLSAILRSNFHSSLKYILSKLGKVPHGSKTSHP